MSKSNEVLEDGMETRAQASKRPYSPPQINMIEAEKTDIGLLVGGGMDLLLDSILLCFS